MATDVERMVLELSADVRKLDAGMKQGQRIIQNSTRAIERDFQRMNQRTVGAVTSMSSGIKASLAGLALGVAAREVAQYADAWTRASNSIRAQGNTVEQTAARMQELVEISLRSRSELASTVTLYNRLTASSQALGVSQAQVARVVETVNKALATSNMTAGERASAVTQLAQGLGSGTLAGDELKAIRENSIVIAQAIADEFGVTIGELKKLGAEGELTSVRVFAAIEKASGSVDAAFGRTRATISDALTNLQTKTVAFIGSLDASTGASAKFGQVVEFVANNLDEIATAAGIAATAIGAGYAAAMTVAVARTVAATASNVAYQLTLIRMATGLKGAAAAQYGLNAALVANPVGLVVVAVAALAGGLFYLSHALSEATIQAKAQEKALADAAPATTHLEGLVRSLAGANDVETASIRRKIAALIDEQRAKAQMARNAYLDARAVAAAEQPLRTNPVTSSMGLPGMGLPSRLRPAPSTTIGPNGNPIDTLQMTPELRRLRAEADAANASVERLQATVNEATTARTASGGADGGGARAARASHAADEVDRLRDEVNSLAYDILTDTEKAAVDLAKVRDTLKQAVARGLITQTQAAALEGGAAAQGLEKVGDATLTPFEDSGRYIADQMAEGLKANQKLMEEQGRDMARSFLDIVGAEDPWKAAGDAFRKAAFDNLEQVLGNIFAQIMNGNAQGGGVGGTIANVVGSLFGGRRALGGPVKAGQFYKVNENTPNSEYFSPSQDGYVGNMKPQRAQATRGPVQMTFRTEYNLQGAAGTEAILGTVQRMQAASERRILTTVQAAAPNAQLEQQLLRG